jgi:DNA topoisomerase VI subunit B
MLNLIISPHPNKHERAKPDGSQQPQSPRKHGAIIGGDRLVWRTDSGGLSLHHGKSQQTLVRGEPYANWRGMFRIRCRNGRTSDMGNLSWIKDAALAIALRSLNSRAQETARKGPPVREKPSRVARTRLGARRQAMSALDCGKAKLHPQVFTTSRLLEFCSQKELTLQTGHPVEQWPLVVQKETVDNALDTCEEVGIAPMIKVIVQTIPSASITVRDNGPGIAAATVKALLDFSVRVSSREAYASPTRGAQGNALKTLVAMPFALDGTEGETIIEACGVRHRIRFLADGIRRVPKIEHLEAASDVKNGTSLTVNWPNSACSILDSAKSRFLQIAEDYAWLNPHLTLAMSWNGERHEIKATDTAWLKWQPSDPTSAYWYDSERFERMAAAYVADDQDHQRSRTIREFISEFRGLSGTAKQKAVLDATATSRMALADLFDGGEADRASIAKLLTAMRGATRPAKPQDLGIIGKEHLAARFAAAGADLKTFNYKRTLRDDGGIPAVIEIAFGYCPKALPIRRIITGVNWSVGINNPFRQLGQYGESLDTFLQEQRAGRAEPIVLVVHLASPHIAYTDRGKSAVALRGEINDSEDDQVRPMSSSGKSIADDIIGGLRTVTKQWTKQRKQEERQSSARAYRTERLLRSYRETIKDVAWETMERAYLTASTNDTLPATARQVMYAARPEIQDRTDRQLDDQYFTQTLLPDYIEEKGVKWDVVFDDRGHFREPHTKHAIGLGTLKVRQYLADADEIDFEEPSFKRGGIVTCGPDGCFGAVLFVEKEGFMPLFEAVNLAERFDVALMSTKGLSVTAARQLIDEMCGDHEIPLLVLHDFDKSGFSIVGTLQRDTRRYTFTNQVEVIDLGLRLDDISELQIERAFDNGNRNRRTRNLSENGATEAEINFLLDKRVELNAMTSDQLVAFVERKLRQHGIKKIVPDKDELALAYRLFARSRKAGQIIKRQLKKLRGNADVEVPHDIEERVHQYLAQRPDVRWDAAVQQIVEAQLGLRR